MRSMSRRWLPLRVPETSRRTRSEVRGRAVLLGGLLSALLVCACADPLAQQLEGRWFGDTLANVDAEYLASATGWARGTSFEFTGSNVTVTIPTELPRTGPFEVVKAEGEQLTVAFRRPNGQVDLALFTMVGPHVMRWNIGDNRAVTLRRTE